MPKDKTLPGEISGYVVRVVDDPNGIVRDDWPAVRFNIELFDGDRVIWAGEYTMGLGCVGNRLPDHMLHRVPGSDERNRRARYIFEDWHREPHAKFLDKQLHADVAAVIVKQRKVKPSPDDVTYSLLRDGEAYFDAETFDDWCANFGEDTDSRKAFSVWQACDEVGRTLTRGLGPDRLAALRELFVDY